MKKQSTLLKGAIIVFTFYITTSMAGCTQPLTDNSGDNYPSQQLRDLPESPIFPVAGNINGLDQMINTESDPGRRYLPAGSSPLISACLFAKKILHCQ